MPNAAELVQIIEVKIVVNGKEVYTSAPIINPLWIDPNSESWPERWSITYGPLRQTAHLTINA